MAKIRDVEPKYGYRLLIELDTGRNIYLNMSDKVETMRFYDLKNVELFNQVETDGFALYWDFGRITISLSEIYEMTSAKREENTVQSSKSVI